MSLGKRHYTHALHDSTEVVASESIGFLVDTDGILECKLEGDSAASDLPVLAGVFYPMTLKLAMSTGTVGPTFVVIVY